MALAPSLTSAAKVLLLVNGRSVVVDVDGANAPVTAGNFVDLVDRGVYDNTSFHRVVRSPQPFVVQGGDPQSKNPSIPTSQLGTGGFTDPADNQPRNIPLEIKPQGAAQPLYSQTFAQAGITQAPQLPHKQGVIAMARASAPDSASSQFYFALQDLPELDGSYAVFGQVSQGFDVVNAVQQGDRIAAARVIGGVVPGRSTALSGNLALVNAAINLTNLVNLPRGFTDLTPGADVVIAPGDAATRTPSGVRGLAGNDVLTGAAGVTNVLWGNEGNDTLTGAESVDYLRGNEGNDVVSGGAGSDIVNGNQDDDTVSGGAAEDVVRGGRGNDALFGDEGDDGLSGDLGIDTLTGGAGADQFVLRVETAAVGQAGDVIVDFDPAQGDRLAVVGSLALSDLSFTASNGGVSIAQGGLLLGVVNNATVDAVRGATAIVSASDAALRL